MMLPVQAAIHGTSAVCAYKRRDRLRAGNIKLLSSIPPIGRALQCCCGIELCTVGDGPNGAPVAVEFTGKVALVNGACTMADDEDDDDGITEMDAVLQLPPR